ncbi:hypothetical protein [Paractinoplanes durhamensis]|uniref:Phage baseplate protein n=1 Tax=Paractinoplanes durhamensis TaxID=113563 RepID=A0ABQ3YVB1_9ACTN|nr:hypothetical protein [Actinoplanes durhamensis]GIE01434.1 hypothetical protein Adu01nite_27840 [Actinoplanes durhamensis]
MSADLLETWERGLVCPGPARALVLHQVARPGAAPDELLGLPVGAREADLCALRRSLFGDRMEVRAECSGCGEALEFDLDAATLASRPDRGGEPLRVVEGGWEVEFRLPTAGDLLAVADRGELIARCTIAARHDGRPVPAVELPEAIQRLLAVAAERADPAGDLTLRVSCPGCGAATPLQLDIAGYLWAELDFWARDLLLDVHVLAGAYGWTEPEILALSPVRRRYYLELCADA